MSFAGFPDLYQLWTERTRLAATKTSLAPHLLKGRSRRGRRDPEPPSPSPAAPAVPVLRSGVGGGGDVAVLAGKGSARARLDRLGDRAPRSRHPESRSVTGGKLHLDKARSAGLERCQRGPSGGAGRENPRSAAGGAAAEKRSPLANARRGGETGPGPSCDSRRRLASRPEGCWGGGGGVAGRCAHHKAGAGGPGRGKGPTRGPRRCPGPAGGPAVPTWTLLAKAAPRKRRRGPEQGGPPGPRPAPPAGPGFPGSAGAANETPRPAERRGPKPAGNTPALRHRVPAAGTRQPGSARWNLRPRSVAVQTGAPRRTRAYRGQRNARGAARTGTEHRARSAEHRASSTES